MDREQAKGLAYQLSYKDNWDVVAQINGWLYVYDKMPPRMRFIVDLKMQGYTNGEIAVMLKIKENQVRSQISRAKKRFVTILVGGGYL